MEVYDYTGRPFSPQEVIEWSREVLDRRERKWAGTMCDLLKAYLPRPLPNEVRFALARQNMGELTAEHRAIAEIVKLHDAMKVLRDRGDILVEKSRGRPRISTMSQTDIKRHLANARRGINGASHRSNWLDLWPGTAPKGVPKKDEGRAYLPKESASVLLEQIEEGGDVVVKVASKAGFSVNDLNKVP